MERAVETLEAQAVTLGARHGIDPHALLRSLHVAFTWDLLRPRAEDGKRKKRISLARDRTVTVVVDTICFRSPRVHAT